MDDIQRICRIIERTAKKLGVNASVYASHKNFDVMTEKWVYPRGAESEYFGLRWIKRKTRDAYVSPGALAMSIRSELKDVWGAR